MKEERKQRIEQAYKDLARLTELENQYEMSEFNINPIDKIQRAKIRAMKGLNRHGSVFIYAINPPYGDNWIVMEYYKGMVYNFTGTFVLPYYDSEIVKRIEAWRKGSFKDINIIDPIWEKPDLVMLNWV